MARSPPPDLARAGAVSITAHLLRELRNRLKNLAIHLERTMNNSIAEALAGSFREALRSYETLPKTNRVILTTVGKLSAVDMLTTVDR